MDDKREGYGKMYWTDGKVYEGHWQAGVMHGKGRMDYKDGTSKEGEWVHGKEPSKLTTKVKSIPLFTPLDMNLICKNDDI